jgi:glycosyltransferase involved in cell wall biosynthesis
LIAPRYGDEPEMPDLTRLRSWRVPFDPEDRFMRAAAVMALEDRIAAENYDLVHIQTPFVAHRAGVRLAERLGLPVIETYHTYFEEYLYHYVPFAPRRAMRALARRFSRSQCNRVDAVVVPSLAMEQALRDYGVTSPIERIPTGLRPEDFERGNGAEFRERYRIRDDRPTLVHIGRLAHEKNTDFLLRMLRRVADQVPDVLLVIAGEGPAGPSLRRLAVDLGLNDNVLFVGYLDRSSDLLDCYRAADGFVFASRTETQGLVLLEAMALAVPVVSTAVMGTKDILDPGLGCLVAEEDEEDFAQQVLRLLSQPKLRSRLRREAKAYALGEWDAGTMAGRLEAVYQRLIEQQPARQRAASPVVRVGSTELRPDAYRNRDRDLPAGGQRSRPYFARARARSVDPGPRSAGGPPPAGP